MNQSNQPVNQAEWDLSMGETQLSYSKPNRIAPISVNGITYYPHWLAFGEFQIGDSVVYSYKGIPLPKECICIFEDIDIGFSEIYDSVYKICLNTYGNISDLPLMDDELTYFTWHSPKYSELTYGLGIIFLPIVNL